MKSLRVSAQGLLLAFMAYMIWACADAFYKLASEEGATPYPAMVVGSLFSVAVLVSKMAAQKRLRELRPKAPMFVLSRGLSNLCLVYCLCKSYGLLPIANAYVIEFAAPFLIAFGAALFLKEPLSKRTIATICIGFFGVFIAIDPHFLGTTEGWGYVAAAAGTVFFATSQLLTKHLSVSEVPEAILLAPNVLGVVIGLIFPPSLAGITPLGFFYLALEYSCGLSGAFMMIAASRRAKASMIAPIQYTQLIPAALFGLLIWGTVPTWNLVFGALLVIAAGSLLTKAHKEDQPVVDAAASPLAPEAQ